MTVTDASRTSPGSPAATLPVHRVAVVGGGASGVLTAINLLALSAEPRLRVEIHEATGIVGRGIAYGTNDPCHLLNVRSRHMSANPDQPADLIEWARRTGRSDDPQAFLPRLDYAAYLQDTLASVADHRLSIRAGRVEDVVPDAGRFQIVGQGDTSTADSVVLASGNQRPRPLVVDDEPVPAAPWHLPDPWDLGALRLLPKRAVVVVVGTGLTAIDTVITLLEEGPGRRVTMVSRHGLLPFPHVGQQSTAWVTHPPTGDLTADALADLYLGQVEAAARQGVGWRAVVDGLRAPTQGLWRRLPLAERRRFLEIYDRYWEVRRHRMAPEVADRLQRYQDEGRLAIRSGGLASVRDRGAAAAVGLADGTTVDADAVVNCTGPDTDVTRTRDPLLRALGARGLVRPDPLRLGLDTTLDGSVVGEGGVVVPGVYTVGPARKGTLWESTAIPEIRGQAAEVARLVLARVPA